MLRRLLKPFRPKPSSVGETVNLVGTPVSERPAAPSAIGIAPPPPVTAWTVSRLERIFKIYNSQPQDRQALLEARHARHCLSSFWLRAPIDQLEALYSGPIGRAYRELLYGSLPSQPLASDETAWKEELADRLTKDFEIPERPNLLLAVMPYCLPGSMRLKTPLSDLPNWLLEDYARCFDPDLIQSGTPPIGLLSQPSPSLVDPLPAPLVRPQTATPAEPPQLSDRRGQEAFSLFQDPDFIERMLGLINLHKLDPDDLQVLQELLDLRRLIGQVWLDVTPSSLEALYRSPLGDVYRALLASNFGARAPEPQEEELRLALTRVAADQEHPAMAQALLAVMPFHPQGKMRLGAGQDRLPLWLQQDFGKLSGMRNSP